MTIKRDSKVWIPRFIREKAVRTSLQAIYTSLVFARENASALLSLNPDHPEEARPAGAPLARQCFTWTLRWISRFREFSENEETFRTQILEPVRSPARFLNEIRGYSTRSTTLQGFVFSRSRGHYDRYFGKEVSTLSISLPELQTCMSLRYPVSALGGVTHGFYSFDGVQPIPYVNRIHPSQLSVSKVGRQIDLGGMDFLKVSLSDVPRIPFALAFESTCIAESFQDRMEHLSFPCIVTGRLLSVSCPHLVLQSAIDEDSTLDLIIADDLASNLPGGRESLTSMRDRWVRILAVIWYGHGVHPAGAMLPEAYWIEEVREPAAVLADDAMGFIRLRGEVPVDQFDSRYPQLNLESLPRSVSNSAGTLQWNPIRNSSDSITKSFLNQTGVLRNLRLRRAGSTSYLSSAMKQLDRKKLRMSGLVGLVARNPDLFNGLVSLIGKQDQAGTLGTKSREVIGSLPAGNTGPAWLFGWLRDIGFIKHTSAGYELSAVGLQVGERVTKTLVSTELDGYFRKNTGPVFDVLEIGSATGLPPSLVVRRLKELEIEQKIQCATSHGRRFELVWLRSQTIDRSAMADAKERVDSIVEKVLAVLRRYNAVGQSKIVEALMENELFNNFAAELVLHELQQRGQALLEIEKMDNRMWSYPRKRRVVDTLSLNPNRIFTLDELTRACNIPPADSIEVYSILKELEQKGLVSEVGNDRWVFAEGGNIFARLLTHYGREFVRSEFGKKGEPIRYAWLISDLTRFLLKWISQFESRSGIRWSSQDARKSAEKIVDEMLAAGEMVRKGSDCFLA